MKYQQPNSETIKQISDLFLRSGWEPIDFDFKTKEDGYYIYVSQMYEYVTFKKDSILVNYQKIANLLGVKDGDEVKRYFNAGCETCNYGSNYVMKLKFW